MKTVVFYEAEDGKRFESEFDCQDYEWKMKAQKFKDDIVMMDADRYPLDLETCYMGDIWGLKVKTSEAAKFIGEAMREDLGDTPWGYNLNSDKVKAGCYIYTETVGWIKLEEAKTWVEDWEKIFKES